MIALCRPGCVVTKWTGLFQRFGMCFWPILLNNLVRFVSLTVAIVCRTWDFNGFVFLHLSLCVSVLFVSGILAFLFCLCLFCIYLWFFFFVM